MELNIPILNQLTGCQNLLIAGMGGGFDIFCGLPLYFELQNKVSAIHLANYSFTEISKLERGFPLTDSLFGVNADIQSSGYFPELYLTQWLREKMGIEQTIWCFEKTGVRPLFDNYNALVEYLKIDRILLIDGGVDSLLHGDEQEIGTILEDTISLIAVSEMKGVHIRLLGCLGMGAERDINYSQILENIARLADQANLLGTCSLTKQMECYQNYENAVLYAQAQSEQDSSIINSSVISAVQGRYGNVHATHKTSGSKLNISPLMSLYWFFDLPAVAHRNLLFPHLRYTDSVTDAYREMLKARRGLGLRKPGKMPLT